ncbi:NXPE family member 3-like [Mantella aurantiaca]
MALAMILMSGQDGIGNDSVRMELAMIWISGQDGIGNDSVRMALAMIWISGQHEIGNDSVRMELAMIWISGQDGIGNDSFYFRFQSMDIFGDHKIPFLKIFGQPANISHSTTAPPIKQKLSELLKYINWPEPSSILQNFTLSTNAKNCDYQLWHPRDTYKVGEKLEVVITARDHNGNPKRYGGDFFIAKLHSKTLKAGVTGHVKDYGNGSYLTSFLLPWSGEAQVFIRLIHSSEAVDVLKKKRESNPEKVYFNGYFHFNGTSKVMECNLELAGQDICKYKDPTTGEIWQCIKPEGFPCDSLIYHSMGGYKKVTNSLEESLLSGYVTDKAISGSFPPINIMIANSSLDLTSTLPACRPGQIPPQPSGFYYNDIWTSLICKSRQFPTPNDILNCLKGKDIHMFGDSTLRQWFEYLLDFIPSLKMINLHTNYQSGPLLAVETDTGLALRWRAHGIPLRTTKTFISDLHYEAAHIAGIAGGPHTVIMLTLWAHFTSLPIRFYLERLERDRQAIASLLYRNPRTTVIIKSANIGYKSIFGSDWLSLQLDILLRAVFKGMEVTIIDTWDMTSCHYLPDNIHPGRPIIRNELDLVLSYLCPK